MLNKVRPHHGRSSLAQVTGYAVGYRERYQPSAAKHVSVTQYASVSCIGYTIRVTVRWYTGRRIQLALNPDVPVLLLFGVNKG